jgi:hypothetical protein
MPPVFFFAWMLTPKPWGMSDMPDDIERAYELGHRKACVLILCEILKQLGYDPEVKTRFAWILEREDAISALRVACSDFGDNDWPDNLNLADVIEKHLLRHLQTE